MAGLNENIMIRLMADTSNYTTRMQAASAQASKLSTALEKPMTTGQKIGAGLTKVGLAVGAVSAAVGVAAVTTFAQFDAAMSTVQANTGASAAELDKLRQAAIDAGANTVYNAQEAADAINELGKAGMSTTDILSGGLSGALNLAASDGMQVSEAAELMSSAMAQFNLTGKQAGNVADALAAGAGKAQGSARDLGYALQQSGMVANSFGIGMTETVGTLTAFANAGMIGSDAGTSLKTMLISLANPSTKAKNLMQELGINAYDAQGNFIGLANLAGQLQDKMGGLTQEQRNQALATIFGSDAIRAANVLYNEGAKGIDKWTKKVEDSGFAAQQAAAKNDNLKGDLENLSGSFESMLITIGSGANGPLRSLV
ncbi:phage tail tape measure protein, partial [Bifidobacterium imperatoris]